MLLVCIIYAVPQPASTLTNSAHRATKASLVNNNPTTETPAIVVVDDDPELLTLIALLVRRIDAQAVTFADPQAAAHYLVDHIPALIILDLMMPTIKGLDLLREIRSQKRFDPVPILILSAKTDPDTIREGLNAGANGYITKPYIANALIDRVRSLLHTKQRNPPR